ncbi:MAG: phosphodiester glycosidase family protein [Planctomycetes bacterium]|nr:phosphodiester glycosidase family protein [Planctomycetota bacterium]
MRARSESRGLSRGCLMALAGLLCAGLMVQAADIYVDLDWTGTKSGNSTQPYQSIKSAAEEPSSKASLVRLEHPPQTPAEQELPLVLWTERRSAPDPLAIHVLRIDLTAPQLEVVSMIADDPDGAGPAEAMLENPTVLATRHRALAAINTNAFGKLPDAGGKTNQSWRSGLAVEILGVAVHEGELRSAPSTEKGNDICFWLDAEKRPHIKQAPANSADMREAVNAFCGQLLADGQVLPGPGGDRHPRTALGVDATGRHLYCVVVDGRQRLFSIGVTSRELAELMLGLGCQQAINLDGGGSSVMLAATPKGEVGIVNRPSGSLPRPVPILLGVRARTVQNHTPLSTKKDKQK